MVQVAGFGDSFGPFSMEMRGQFPMLSLQSLYTAIVGPRAEQHDAASDAEAVYRLLETTFGASPLSLNIPQVRYFIFLFYYFILLYVTR
jgi:hypothetical protein